MFGLLVLIRRLITVLYFYCFVDLAVCGLVLCGQLMYPTSTLLRDANKNLDRNETFFCIFSSQIPFSVAAMSVHQYIIPCINNVANLSGNIFVSCKEVKWVLRGMPIIQWPFSLGPVWCWLCCVQKCQLACCFWIWALWLELVCTILVCESSTLSEKRWRVCVRLVE